MASIVVSKETVHRLLKDVKQIIKSPLLEHGIHYHHDEEDMLKGYALIIGPSDTPYFGGYYLFELNFPVDYPHSPPKVFFRTNGDNIRFNPNLYICGKVCVSLLNTWRGDQWTSCQTISTVLLTLCSLLCKDPLLNEPGVSSYHKDINSYNQIIEFSNIYIAICDIINKKTDVFLKNFYIFYPVIKEHFLTNYNKHIKFIEDKLANNPNSFRLTTDFYKLNITINYNKLLTKLNNTIEFAQKPSA